MLTIAYCNVVSIRLCPKSCCSCSIGIPLSIAIVASVRRNLCGCTFVIPRRFPRLRSRTSIPPTVNRVYRENQRLESDNKYLSAKNAELQKENRRLRSENKDFALLKKVFGKERINGLMNNAREMVTANTDNDLTYR